MRKTINISLTEKLKKEVDNTVKSGQYSSRSEFFRDAIRAWKKNNNLNKSVKKNNEKTWNDLSKERLLDLYDESDSIYDKI
jgi:putative addiction module CopG family antidote